MVKLKIKKGDEVIVLVGRDKGMKGKVLKVFPLLNKIKVSGVNLVTKHLKPSKQSAGRIVQEEACINISNVALVDPKFAVATKVGFKFLEDGSKVRFAKKSGEIFQGDKR
jgi:large subunit ribosomal protein L24